MIRANRERLHVAERNFDCCQGFAGTWRFLRSLTLDCKGSDQFTQPIRTQSFYRLLVFFSQKTELRKRLGPVSVVPSITYPQWQPSIWNSLNSSPALRLIFYKVSVFVRMMDISSWEVIWEPIGIAPLAYYLVWVVSYGLDRPTLDILYHISSRSKSRVCIATFTKKYVVRFSIHNK